jgi:hypothetical protein
VFLISGLGAGMFHDNAKLEEQNLQKKYWEQKTVHWGFLELIVSLYSPT